MSQFDSRCVVINLYLDLLLWNERYQKYLHYCVSKFQKKCPYSKLLRHPVPNLGVPTPIHSVSRTTVAPSLYNWPVQITQLYGGDCPANTVDCLTLQILSAKTNNLRFLANPTDKYARQCIWAPRLWLGGPLHWLPYLSVGFARHCRLSCVLVFAIGFATFLQNFGPSFPFNRVTL